MVGGRERERGREGERERGKEGEGERGGAGGGGEREGPSERERENTKGPISAALLVRGRRRHSVPGSQTLSWPRRARTSHRIHGHVLAVIFVFVCVPADAAPRADDQPAGPEFTLNSRTSQ